MAERIAVTGVTLIDGTGTDPLERAVVVIEGAMIADVGLEANVRLERGTRVLDASGATVMPGLVDVHCHLGGNSHPDEDSWVLQPDRYQAIASVAQACALLRHGVTSARDISVNGTHLNRAIRDGLVDGPRIVPCWRGLSPRGGTEMPRGCHRRWSARRTRGASWPTGPMRCGGQRARSSRTVPAASRCGGAAAG